ncbi:dihydrolipoamide dehydrogenase [Apiospora sp. TS-2023a]
MFTGLVVNETRWMLIIYAFSRVRLSLVLVSRPRAGLDDRGLVAIDSECRTKYSHICYIRDYTFGLITIHKAMGEAVTAIEYNRVIPSAVYKITADF